MSTKNNKLALRKQSIRTITSGPRTTITSGTCIPTRTTAQTTPTKK